MVSNLNKIVELKNSNIERNKDTIESLTLSLNIKDINL